MSKSLGNLVFVGDLLKEWEPAAVRLALLAHHYRPTGTGPTSDMPRAAAPARGAGGRRRGAPAAAGDGAGARRGPGALDDDLDTPGRPGRPRRRGRRRASGGRGRRAPRRYPVDRPAARGRGRRPTGSRRSPDRIEKGPPMAAVTVRLPDGSTKELDAGTTAPAPGRSPSAPAWPRRPWPPPSTGPRSTSTRPLPDGALVAIVTADSDAGRAVLRHSTAHVLAQAVLRLWPGAHYAIGPVIEDGFYYDFELPGGAHFSDDDLERIEATMREIMAEDQPFVRDEHTIDEGLALFADQPFKREIIEAVGAGPRRGGRGGRGRRAAAAVSTYWNSPDLHRPVPRAPRALDQPARALQADAGGRRLLAGRREAPAAAAHLRHGLGVGEGPGRAPPPAGGGRAPRPPQARCRARPVLLPRGDRLGPGRVPPQGRHRPPADGGLLAPAPRGGRLRVRVHARTSPRPSCSRRRATSTGSPRACSRPWSSTAASSTTSSR